MLAGHHAVAILLLALLLPAAAAASLDPYCDDNSTYAANGTFQANLDLLAAALPANASASATGSATAAVGAAPDQADALAFCRGDTNASSCAACVAAAFRDARRACPLHKGVTVYRDACVLRFAGRRFLDFLRDDKWLVSELVPAIDTALGSVNASDAWFTAGVKAILTVMVDRTAAAAAASNTTRNYFATAEMEFHPKLYGLAQCAPGLTPAQCHSCLGYLLAVVTTQLLSGRAPGRSAFVVWCSLRYSVRRIYDGQAMLQLPAPSQPATTLTSSSSGLELNCFQVSPDGV
nr:unnamed protein product [Digitaria exilis]